MSATTQTNTEPTTGNRARVRRYRAAHTRIDYVPSPSALAVIEAWQSRKLDNCKAGIIDRLLLAGHKAMTREEVSGHGVGQTAKGG